MSQNNILPKGVKDITGLKTGKLTVLSFSYLKRRSYWNCICECGNKTVKPQDKLFSGELKSCGCLFGTITNKRIHSIWVGMKSRVLNKNNKEYSNYGGRGIKVCDEWLTYDNFEYWALNSGYEESLTLDRIDVNGNYSPINCRWGTWQEQALNRRNRKYVGIYPAKRINGIVYRAALKRDGKSKHLGTFDTLKEAYEARQKAIEEYSKLPKRQK